MNFSHFPTSMTIEVTKTRGYQILKNIPYCNTFAKILTAQH